MTIELAIPDTPDSEPRLHRFAADGRYLGFIVQDRPGAQYAERDDLTDEAPPEPQDGFWPYRTEAGWTCVEEPPRPAPLTHQPAPAPAP